MKYWKQFIVVFILAVAFTMLRNSFKKESATVFNEVVVDSLYSIELPDYLNKTDILNKVASLQYMNQDKHVYVTVIDESNKFIIYSIDTYFNKMLDRYTGQIEKVKIIESKDFKVNGLNSKYIYLSGTTPNETMYLKYAVIESNTYFYQIASWTFVKDNTYFDKDVMNIIESFKEINAP